MFPLTRPPPAPVGRLKVKFIALALCACASACDRPASSGTHPDPIPPQPTPSEPAPQPSRPAAPTDHHPAGYQLAYAEEFEGYALDRRQWCTRYVYAGGPPLQLNDFECTRDAKGTLDFLNDEQQRYRDMDATGKPLHEVRDGMLTLIATKSPGAPHYEAGMVRSKRLFKPDETKTLYITARVKLPSVRGTWPAFWLNSDRDERGNVAWPPEIDIFEAPLNGREDRDTMLKVGAATRGREKKMVYMASSFSERWRNYNAPKSLRDKWIETGLEWTKDGVCYFLDGTKLMCEDYQWIHNDGRQAPPAHILLNLAIGGEWAGRHGIDDAKFPAKFSIDYVRVYERPTAAAGAGK